MPVTVEVVGKQRPSIRHDVLPRGAKNNNGSVQLKNADHRETHPFFVVVRIEAANYTVRRMATAAAAVAVAAVEVYSSRLGRTYKYNSKQQQRQYNDKR